MKTEPTYRTFWQVVMFVAASTFLGFTAIQYGSDLLSATAMIAGMGAGITGIKFGRSMEKKAMNGHSNGGSA